MSMAFAPISMPRLSRSVSVSGQRKEAVSFRKVNTKHDATTYECCSYQREISDLDVLYSSFQKAKKGSDWKPQVQRFEINLLSELVRLRRELNNRTYALSPLNQFVLRERGKTRVISGDHIRDRVVKRALCDEVLIPSIRKYLIHDNGASLKGKGISFTGRRLEVHLRRYYREHGNEGYVYLADYSKFFDNIQHEKLMGMFRCIIDDNLALWLLEKVLKQAEIDVSYMSDSEYAKRYNTVFDSLAHKEIDKALLTGEKYLRKHMNIGDQVAQVAGIFYPHRLDNYIKIVEGVKYYARYMDDSYVIHKDKGYLLELADRIEQEALKNGIFINKRKTHICRLSDYWRFLQIQYALTNTGRIIKKIHPKRLTDMRRKLKKLVRIMGEQEFVSYYNAWFRNHYRLMSKKQRNNMDALVEALRRETHD